MPFTPYNAAVHCIGRANALLDRASISQNRAVAGDLRRLSVVMAVAALDAYMHRVIVGRVYEHAVLPGKLANLTFPFAFALEQADDVAQAARADPYNNRPRVGLKRALRDRLLRETYQRYEDVSAALGMAGLGGNWEKIGQRLATPLTPNEIRERLNGIVDRRNQIVHEGDYERLDRPQTARMNGITQREASTAVSFIADLIDAIHAVA